MSIESVRISKQGRDQLITLKRRTKIENWNILCRWALCVSLADPTPPRQIQISTEGGVEMTWKTFGGEYEEIYYLALKERCKRDGHTLDNDSICRQFRLHIHRGIASLMGSADMKTIGDLIGLVTK